MTPRHRALTAFFALATVVSPAAQQKPNFSGRWVVVSPADGAGQEQNIKHDGTSLLLSHDSEGGGHNIRYVLDGRQNRNTLPSHGSEIATIYTASWKGDRLTIVSTSTYPNGGKLNQTETWSLDEKGRLIIEVDEEVSGQPKRRVTVIHTRK